MPTPGRFESSEVTSLRAWLPLDMGLTDTGLREIKFYKNQYGAISSSCYVRYTNGLFLPVEGMAMGTAERAAKAEEVFLRCLKKFTAQHQTVNHLRGKQLRADTICGTDRGGRDRQEGT